MNSGASDSVPLNRGLNWGTRARSAITSRPKWLELKEGLHTWVATDVGSVIGLPPRKLHTGASGSNVHVSARAPVGAIPVRSGSLARTSLDHAQARAPSRQVFKSSVMRLPSNPPVFTVG